MALPATPAQLHVLVIDNDPAVRTLIQQVLQDEGHRVSTMDYAVKAIAAVADLVPDVIVLDYLWAGNGDGWGFLHLLRTDLRTRLTPVVLCTAAVVEVRALEPQLAALAVPVVIKPFLLEKLVSAIALAGALRVAAVPVAPITVVST